MYTQARQHILTILRNLQFALGKAAVAVVPVGIQKIQTVLVEQIHIPCIYVHEYPGAKVRVRHGIVRKLAHSSHSAPLFSEFTRHARLRDEAQFCVKIICSCAISRVSMVNAFEV